MDSYLQMVMTSLKGQESTLLLLVAGCLFLCGRLIPDFIGNGIGTRDRQGWGVLAFTAFLISGYFALSIGPGEGKSGLFVSDSLSHIGERLAIVSGLIIVLIGWDSAPRKSLAEYYGCLLILFSGVLCVASANDATTLFLGLELVSIPTYVLLGLAGTGTRGLEAMLKYFVLSATASAVFLIGFSHLYGMAGTTDLIALQKYLGVSDSWLTHVTFIFVICGIAFRMTAVPFHAYASDVFAGTSLSVSAVLSYVPKLVGFLALARLIGLPEVGKAVPELWITVLTILSIVTMCIGNLLALMQSQVRRLMAYSSVAHSGYLLLAFAAALQTSGPLDVVWSYLSAYALMTLGIFAVLDRYRPEGHEAVEISDLKGMWSHQPWIAAMTAICLLSLMGMPLTGGFWAKLQVFLTAVGSNTPLLRAAALVGAINAVIAVAYYWRTMVAVFSVGNHRSPRVALQQRWPSVIALTACSVLTVIWFFAPHWM